MIPPNSSLVKYDNPVLVSRNTDKKSPKARSLKVSQQQGATMAGTGPVPQPPRTNKLPPMDAQKNQQTDEILNAILPPREWTENGQLWVQQVSSTPATRLDVVNLQVLTVRLDSSIVSYTSSCLPVTSVYINFLITDELIRQVTINCAERGLLLLRVRDEIRMTIAAYQTLYESSVAFGMRKALQAEQGKADMEQKIQELEGDKRDLERQVNELKAKCDAIEKREAERRAVEEKKHAEEIQFLKRTNQQLKTQLEGIIAPTKK
ncbi:PREDICTED: 33 kDa inner dynein arm light chain, axonemal-like [Acropora digitifera]|uniref:33 kDa inner dynein arm light chain, axonemal-like n=1 Tax=Acropora digitifera TaxID=70779 RepID=UPI00077AC3FA|nr:PREDICTED: 33 kDa inner dynein arm light chain, axonemal-like [Acropora digitifera]